MTWLDEAPDRPAYVWGCTSAATKFDLVESLSDHMYDNAYESAFEHVDGDLLKQAQALIGQSLANIVSWLCDHTVAVIVPPRAPAPEASNSCYSTPSPRAASDGGFATPRHRTKTKR